MSIGSRQVGFTVWLTGLPAAGKSTIGDAVADYLSLERTVERLDGDSVRRHLSSELGFSREHRRANVLRIAWIASRLNRFGAAVIVSAIAPYAVDRADARQLICEFGMFVEVYVATPLEECVRRDPKGLYCRARSGDLRGLTGIDDPYEVPESPSLAIDTRYQSPNESTSRVLDHLAEVGLYSGDVRPPFKPL